jgi:glycosyltransferase involved in cell wall biosynthesis
VVGPLGHEEDYFLMNILVINWRDLKHPEGGGAEVHFTEIFKRIVRKGHRVSLLTTRFKNCVSEEVQEGIRIYRWGHTYTFNWETPFLVRKICKRENIDCIIDDVNKIPFFSPRWFRKKPVGAFFHHLFGNTIFELAPRPMAGYVLFLEKMCRWGYRDVPCCTVSESTASDLAAQGFDRSRITIVENSVDTDFYSPVSGQKKDRNTLLYFGRLKRYKNIDILIDALKILVAQQNRDCTLVIGGAGDDRQRLKEYAQECGLAYRIDFKGYVSEAEKLDLYRRATIFVNPSLKEGWGITNIEANACGTAVVANDAPGLRDSVCHGESGLLYTTNDVHSLVDTISMLLDSREKRKMLEKKGRKWALQFSWDRSAEKVEQWLYRVLSEKRS